MKPDEDIDRNLTMIDNSPCRSLRNSSYFSEACKDAQQLNDRFAKVNYTSKIKRFPSD
ncbi:10374_t:CDS:2 [Dentiscutata heterogama]|uniref:10374_t:CDS:1 n=1 Tax=Dentiscutata heterogama TaxID=1316150 RepID=A0ACA9KKT1_9GLOM|nr:10374_t:CDS:2 [Dentiscutata heterogama]